MEGKTQNIQDVYLNTVRREKIPVTIFLMSGVKLMGRLRGFDKYSVILEANHQDQLIFKHAISTVTTSRQGPSTRPQDLLLAESHHHHLHLKTRREAVRLPIAEHTH